MRAPPARRKARGGLEAVTADFLVKTRRAALGHFTVQRVRPSDCHTMQRTVPPQPGSGGCNGTIVAHMSAHMFHAWAAATPGSPADRTAHVMEQVQLMLEDLTDRDIHGYLALTDAQCQVYRQDLEQLVAESLERTTFSGLNRATSVHWEGTLVRSLQPPSLVLVVSIDF